MSVNLSQSPAPPCNTQTALAVRFGDAAEATLRPDEKHFLPALLTVGGRRAGLLLRATSILNTLQNTFRLMRCSVHG